MEAIIAFAVAFGMIILAELGDKTQLMTISFSSRYSRRTVFLGAWLGMGLVTVVGVAIGLALGTAFDAIWVKVIAAAVFIIFGVWTLVKREGDEREEKSEISDKGVFLQILFLFLLAEFGDKTQLAVIALTAAYSAVYGAFVAILIGAILGFAVIVAVGVLIGKEIGKRVDSKKIVVMSGILFIIIGLLVAVEAFLG